MELPSIPSSGLRGAARQPIEPKGGTMPAQPAGPQTNRRNFVTFGWGAWIKAAGGSCDYSDGSGTFLGMASASTGGSCLALS